MGLTSSALPVVKNLLPSSTLPIIENLLPSESRNDSGANQLGEQAAMSRYKARIARQKQRQMHQQAAITRQHAESQARKQRSTDSRRLARMRANIGGRGIQLTGSPLLAYGNEARSADFDARNLSHQGKMKAWKQDRQADQHGQQARMHDYQAARSDAEVRRRMRERERNRGKSLLTQGSQFVEGLLG